MHINLTTNPFVCDLKKQFCFPMGEYHLQINPDADTDICTIKLQHPTNLINLVLVVNAARNMGCNNFHLYMPYFPYARQDRVCVTGEPFSLYVICDMLNALNLNRVTCIDPHSSQVERLCSNLQAIPQYVYSRKAVRMSNVDYLISPDRGAVNKVELLASIVDLPIVQCHKRRNPETGKLDGFEIIHGRENIHGKGLIVDDICDGGGTFLGIRKLFDGDVSLYVTHGGFTKGLLPLKDFSSIITTNSLNQVYNEDDSRKYNIPFSVLDCWEF